MRLEISAVKRQFVDILGGLAAASHTDRRSARTSRSSTFTGRRRQHSSSSTCSSSPESKRLSGGGHLFDAERPMAAETKTTMRRSCAASVLACSARTEPPSDLERIAASDHPGDPHRRPRSTRRLTLSGRRRLSENKENIADNERRHYNKLPDSFSVCKPNIRYPRLFPDLNKVVEEEEQSSLVRTSSVVSGDLQHQATSTTMSLEDVSAISRTSDADGGVLHRVRSTTSVSSLNGAFCSSSGDAENEATAAAGAFCSTFSYPLHSTVIDSFFDVSALLPPRPLPSPGAASDIMADGRSPSQRRQLDGHADGSSQNSCRPRYDTEARRDSLHPRLFDDIERPNSLLGDVSNSFQLADIVDVDHRRRTSSTVEQLSPSSTTEMDFARTGDANCTARLRRQMGQTRLYTTNSSSSQRQSDFTCSRLNVDDDCSRSTLFECGCSAEQRFRHLPTAAGVESNILPTSKNFSLSRSHRRYAEQFESPACFVDSCRSWSSDRRRMTMHCPPTTRSDALSMVDQPTDFAVRHDGRQMVPDDRRQTVCRQIRSSSHRRTADERLDRRQRAAIGPRDHVGGCPLCGCGRTVEGDAAAGRWSKTSKLTSSNCDNTAEERRRKRALLRKLRRFSDALYSNTGELQLKTFGHF